MLNYVRSFEPHYISYTALQTMCQHGLVYGIINKINVLII